MYPVKRQISRGRQRNVLKRVMHPQSCFSRLWTNCLLTSTVLSVMPGAQLTRLEIPNARAKPATRQWVTHCSFVMFLWSLRFRAGHHSRSQILRFWACLSCAGHPRIWSKYWTIFNETVTNDFFSMACLCIMLWNWKNSTCPNHFVYQK